VCDTVTQKPITLSVDLFVFETGPFILTGEYTVVREQDAEARESRGDGITSQTDL
jgi:hypothetical protein